MERPLYELDHELLPPNAFHAKFSELTGPTSLFQNLKRKDVKPSVQNKKDAPSEEEKIERPLTPIEEAIPSAVSSVNEVCQLLQRRINVRLGPVPGLSPKQQQMLVGVIFSELKSSWADVKKLAPVSYLTNQQNQELERRIAIEVVLICEDLYFKTLEQAKALNDKGVFSSYANISRLKGQLALETNKSLDIIKIHKRLAGILSAQSSLNAQDSSVDRNIVVHSPPTTFSNLKKRVIKKRTRHIGPVQLTREEKDKIKRDNDMTEIQAHIPDISVEKIEKKFGISRYDFYKSSLSPLAVKQDDSTTPSDLEETRFSGIRLRTSKHLSQSLPNILVGDSIYDELGIENVKKAACRRFSVDSLNINLACSAAHAVEDRKTVLDKSSEGSLHVVSEDLRKLMAAQDRGKEFLPEEEELSPLLQALTHNTKKKKRLPSSVGQPVKGDCEICSTVASSVACNKDLEERDVQAGLSEKPVQLATISTRMPDKSVVRTSDVRVSRRVNKSGAILSTFPTVYNDLIGEIDSVAVKWLDRNLFIGDEVREVYDEIIKTVGTEHLLFDQDPYVVQHATEANLSTVFHSGLLTGGKSDKVVNPSLQRDVPPPWGSSTIDRWRNHPMFGDLGRQDILNIGAQGMADLPGKVSKSYNSWLAWWRSTITTDDYYKFLSTQDNDYLSLTYHLYESDDAGSDDDSDKEHTPNARQLRLQRAKEEKLVEIRKLKENYEAGYWNANSVLIGGLGKYPDIKDEELCIDDNASEPCSPVEQRTKNTEAHQDASPLSVQERLDRVWSLLCMPDALRLDMAIKYSSEMYFDKLDEMIVHWESAVKLVLSRESLITKLEDFERLASDPNRFFEKGNAGSASSRIKEAKTRRQFHQSVDKLEEHVKRVVKTIEENYGDIVTFQGRAYLDKMSSDRTEMLYWLQQERREKALDMAKRIIELKVSEIPPIPVHHVL